MKTLSKMVTIGGVLIVASLLNSNTALAENSRRTTILQTYTNASSFAVFLGVTGRGCGGGSGWWGFNHTTAEGAKKMDILKMAYAYGWDVELVCSSRYGSWNDISVIYTYANRNY